MAKTNSISEMHKFHFGRKIFCSDGEDGVLTHVCYDPASFRMTHIGVKLGRLIGSRTVYIPFDSIVTASGDGINLKITRADLESASKEEPAGALLDQRSAVRQDKGAAKGVLVFTSAQPESGELAYIVARDVAPGQSALLSREVVSHLERGVITVSISDAALKTLPPYRSDRELQQEVEDILFDLTPLHVDFKGMQVRVLDAVLYLDGNISSSLRGDIVRDQARGVQGLLEIKNRLIGDDQLAGDLALALAHDPRTRELPIGVYPRLGAVRLSGAVRNSQQKEAAGQIARAFPGAHSVVNDLLVDSRTDALGVMASTEGSGVEDKIPGRYIRHTK